jgi:hypothetical protein
MGAKAPRDSVIAVVGEGFGSLVVHTTARYLGFTNEDITIFGTNDNPVGTYQQFAYNLGQTVLRSESESHFLAPDWPTFAQIDALAHRSPAPLYRSIRRKYNPGVSEILTEAAVVAKRMKWEDSRVSLRIGWLQREMNPTPHFVLYDEQANFVGRAKHVMLAVGHGPLSFPPALAKARKDRAIADRIVQAYEPKQYSPDGRYIVLGAGIASVNEWANILDIGGSVLALTRQAQPETQDLNVPRCLFESQGIDAYVSLSFDQRIRFLGDVLRGTRPQRKTWLQTIEDGRKEGRFDALVGEITEVERGRAGLRTYVESRDGTGDPGWLDVTGVTAGTGFNKSVLTIPLLRRLVQHYGVPVQDGRMKLLTNCGVPGLDRPDSRLCCMGLIANNVIPHGDTIAGLKYVGRRFVSDCARAEHLRRRPFRGRLALQASMGRDVARALRNVDPTKQLA